MKYDPSKAKLLSDQYHKSFEEAGLIDANTNFKYTIKVVDGKISVHSKGGMHTEAAIHLFAEIILNVAKQAGYATQDQAGNKFTDAEICERIEFLYDLLNNTFSGVLRLFAPQIDLRPNLTADAIKKAENEILDNVIDFQAKREQKQKEKEENKNG